MKKTLFISHRIPYPPNKGDKIRAFQIIEALRRLDHDVSLAFLIDDKNDKQYLSKLKRKFGTVIHADLKKWRAYSRMVRAFFTREPLTMLHHYSRELKIKIQQLRQENDFDYVIYYSGASLNYFDIKSSATQIVDYVDADSAKWKTYSQKAPFPLRQVYRKESVRMALLEQEYIKKSDLTIFVTEEEADFFKRYYNISEQAEDKIVALHNTVDSHYFTPDFQSPDPYKDIFPQHIKQICVFTGEMNYPPNIEAVEYFANDILPAVTKELGKDIGFAIVGRNPTQRVKRLCNHPNIYVTGSVPDVRPYIKHASAVVCPLLTARGVQNKVLEAMSCGKALIVSPEAFEGIKAKNYLDMLLAKNIEEWAIHLREVLNNKDLAERLGGQARRTILDHYAPDNMPLYLRNLLKQADKNKKIANLV